MWPARCATVCSVAAATAMAACGGHAAVSQRAAQAPDAAAGARPPSQGNGIDPAILPPHHVPRHGSGPADPDAARVIRGWLRALRRGDIARAASYFAIPSRFQNGTPVLTLDTRTEVLAVNISFPCGAVATRLESAGPFTLVRFRLTSRVNGDCRGAEGHTTGGAIRVAGGHIREWYRLYDADEAKPGNAAIDPGNEQA
jgi:hypothetical protein